MGVLLVLLRHPGKAVNPEKAEHMVDAETVKNQADRSDALPPPGVILRTVHGPVVKRDSPILSPTAGKFASAEEGFRRRAARPGQVKELVFGPDIGAVGADTEGNVPGQTNVVFIGPGAHLGPLAPGEPLHV